MIVFDCDYLCNVAKHAMKGTMLTDPQGLHTDIMFNFFTQIRKVLKEFGGYGGHHKLAFVWDSHESLRRKLFPEYKLKRRTHRTELSEEEQLVEWAAREQFKRLQEVLHDLGFRRIYKEVGYEGDDLIASIVLNNPNEYFLIVTNDKDMLQLLRDNVQIYNLGSKKLITKETFIEEHGIQPEQWSEVLALAGCNTDEVPGIRGVGIFKATEFLKGNLGPRNKSYRDIISEEGQQLRKRNIKLVKLPLEGTPVIKVNNVEDQLYRYQLENVFDRLGFHSFTKEAAMTEWVHYLILNLRRLRDAEVG